MDICGEGIVVKGVKSHREEFHGPTLPDAVDQPSSWITLLFPEWLLREGWMKPEWSAIMVFKQGEFHTDAVNQEGSHRWPVRDIRQTQSHRMPYL